MSQPQSHQSGQIALAVLLIMMVVLVVSLAVASRTTKDIAQTTQTTEAAQVFSAAESGAEAQLNQVIMELQKGNIPPDVIPTPANDGTVQVSTAMTGSSVLTQELAQGETAQVLLDPASALNQIRITWAGDADPDAQASLIVAQYYTENNIAKVEYKLLEACGVTNRNDGFETPSTCPSVGQPTEYVLDIHPSSANITPQFVRIQAVYYGTDLTVTGEGVDLPAQQFVIHSEAVNTSTDLQENSALDVTASHLLPPPFLDYVLYSGGSITK